MCGMDGKWLDEGVGHGQWSKWRNVVRENGFGGGGYDEW